MVARISSFVNYLIFRREIQRSVIYNPVYNLPLAYKKLQEFYLLSTSLIFSMVHDNPNSFIGAAPACAPQTSETCKNV